MSLILITVFPHKTYIIPSSYRFLIINKYLLSASMFQAFHFSISKQNRQNAFPVELNLYMREKINHNHGKLSKLQVQCQRVISDMKIKQAKWDLDEGFM